MTEYEANTMRMELECAKAALAQAKSDAKAAIAAAVKLCVYGQPHDDYADEWRAAARAINELNR